MKNHNTILEQRNKIVNGFRTYIYKFKFKDWNRTEVLTNNVFINEKTGELIINNHLINTLINKGYEYEMIEGAFKSYIPDANCDKHRLEQQPVKRIFPEEWDD